MSENPYGPPAQTPPPFPFGTTAPQPASPPTAPPGTFGPSPYGPPAYAPPTYAAPTYGAGTYGPAPTTGGPAGTGRKSFLTAWLLSLLVGGFGVDRFYLGKVGTGILKLVTLGGFGVWTLIDLILLIRGGTRDKNGDLLEGYEEHRKLATIITIVVVALGLVMRLAESGQAHHTSYDHVVAVITAPSAL